MRHEWKTTKPAFRGQTLCAVEASSLGEELYEISASGRQMVDELIRLAEENLALRKVILRDGDIRRAQPVFHQRITDLEEEVQRLRGQLEKWERPGAFDQ